MKKLLFTATALCALAALTAGSAIAADLAVRPIYRTPVAASTWTGFYVGLNAGGSIGTSQTTDSGVFSSPFFVPFNGLIGSNVIFNETFRHNPTGGLFGGQVGYNWQTAPNFVVGLEADWQWAWQRDTAYVGACNSPVSNGFFNAGPGAFGSGFSQCLSDEQKLTNFGTARVRAGYLMHDTLFYGTAGAAWGTIKNNFALSTNFDPTSLATPFNPFFGGGGNFSHTKGGYTLGGGVETRLWGAWSLKLEYLYVDLGTTTDAFPVGINPAPFLTVNGPGVGAAIVANSSYTITSSSHFRDNIVRVGLNYKPW